jgi:tetraacyldisaccharide 4'-kinase
VGRPWSVDQLWFGSGPLAGLARAALFPAEQAYAAIVAARGALYDRELLGSHAPPIPVLSIGNLTVGGTGKTPIAAWAAAELMAAGGSPAIILRGYGDDEPLVHARLHPSIPVITSADRIAGAHEARARGADVAVLDDAFQHRRIRREADWVLVSADRWTQDRPRLLPAGPWREPVGALRRASVAIVTRKAASRSRADAVKAALGRSVPEIPVAVVHLAPDGLRSATGSESRVLDTLRGARVRLIAAVGDPGALQAQIEGEGATVDPRFFPDHHAFTEREIAELAAGAGPDTLILCTLKDAVKIAPGWPRAAPALWYVSQRVIVEDGLDQLSRSIRIVLRARSSDPDAAGARRPSL